jgi:prenylcysteine oxidase / farnesylcysteine lyase
MPFSRTLGQPLALLLIFVLATTGLTDQPQIPLSSNAKSRQPHKVAIIGGGAGGASAAYHLRRFADESEHDIPIEITLYEKESRIGGRTTTVNALDDPGFPVEVGGSIFVKVNHILYNATRDFGLDVTTRNFQGEGHSDFDLGVWDGQQWVFKQSSSDSRWQGYWDVAKLLWKYGLAPIRTRSLTKTMLSKFLRFYEEPLFPFSSLTGVIEETGLLEDVSLDGKTMLEARGAGGGFANDIVQASTRVNYAQDLSQIHGVETLVCMATEGGMAVRGGNWQIFDEAVKRSGATTVMNTSVHTVSKSTAHGHEVYNLSLSDGESHESYDAVILATPYQFADTIFSPALAHTPAKIEYVKLQVTLFTSPHLISPTFFGSPKEETASIPYTILTSRSPCDACDEAGGSTDFFSISNLRTLYPSPSSNLSSPQYLYKIFSPKPLTANFLSRLLDVPRREDSIENEKISQLSKDDVSWVHEKLWHSYPHEIPRTEFEHIRLDGEELGSGRGVWYTSGIESFISTMETSALMGRNVAGLIVKELEAKRHGQ